MKKSTFLRKFSVTICATGVLVKIFYIRYTNTEVVKYARIVYTEIRTKYVNCRLVSSW